MRGAHLLAYVFDLAVWLYWRFNKCVVFVTTAPAPAESESAVLIGVQRTLDRVSGRAVRGSPVLPGASG